MAVLLLFEQPSVERPLVLPALLVWVFVRLLARHWPRSQLRIEQALVVALALKLVLEVGPVLAFAWKPPYLMYHLRFWEASMLSLVASRALPSLWVLVLKLVELGRRLL